jgi:hypothetical protein
MIRSLALVLSTAALLLAASACNSDCPACDDLRDPTPVLETGVSSLRLCVANVPITGAEDERACAAVSVTYLLPTD